MVVSEMAMIHENNVKLQKEYIELYPSLNAKQCAILAICDTADIEKRRGAYQGRRSVLRK